MNNHYVELGRHTARVVTAFVRGDADDALIANAPWHEPKFREFFLREMQSLSQDGRKWRALQTALKPELTDALIGWLKAQTLLKQESGT